VLFLYTLVIINSWNYVVFIFVVFLFVYVSVTSSPPLIYLII